MASPAQIQIHGTESSVFVILEFPPAFRNKMSETVPLRLSGLEAGLEEEKDATDADSPPRTVWGAGRLALWMVCGLALLGCAWCLNSRAHIGLAVSAAPEFIDEASAGYKYSVVVGDKVTKTYYSLQSAKHELNSFPKGASKPSRMICEVKNGVVTKSPSKIGPSRQNQAAGVKAGFNK